MSDFLANAARQARDRNYGDLLIVDADAHHYETRAPWRDIRHYIEDGVVRQRIEASLRSSEGGTSSTVRAPIGDRTVGGRVQRWGLGPDPDLEEGQYPDVEIVLRAMDQMGIDYSILFPTTLLNIGILPEIDVQSALMWAYACWLTERVLPRQPRLRTLVCLPFNDPEASLRMVQTFGEREGVVGFVVGSTFHHPVHSKRYLKTYAAIEQLGKPIAFHSTYNWHDRLTEQFNKFLLAHGIGRTLYNVVHLANWTINGIPERFPGLRVIWIESGVTWIPFVMQRLDAEYMMRSSEAPLLRKRPSEYMQEYYYTAQPLEVTRYEAMLRQTFEMIDARNHLLYASDYPHWDFDLPSAIYDLPFLTDEARRNILGGNARRLFGLPVPEPLPTA
ncbi:MAG: amidohydrolase family protein [Acidimicrobiaceae bacterium]|nr:amidohydrolase family protein [Acidimicrobiaceae bacterium]